MARAREARKAPKVAVKVAPKAPTALKAVPPGAASGFDLAELRHLIRLVQKTGIGEIELNSGGRSVRISANPAGAGTWVSAPAAGGAAMPRAAAAPPAAEAKPAADPDSHLKAVLSPMVGTFYRSPAPDADPFVELGDVIEVGQTVCIIEAMKLMNEIEAETKGRVVRILIENAQPVEFGQKLFLVEPL
jgi:acetyl-CoA carboxylase biotin carboxyl carrier protein